MSFLELKSSKPEPGELSSLNSSSSSKKDDSLRRDRESQDLNDSEEEEDEGDLLEDDDEVTGAKISVTLLLKTSVPNNSPFSLLFTLQIVFLIVHRNRTS